MDLLSIIFTLFTIVIVITHFKYIRVTFNATTLILRFLTSLLLSWCFYHTLGPVLVSVFVDILVEIDDLWVENILGIIT